MNNNNNNKITIINYLKSKEFWLINLILIITAILSLIIFLYIILPIITRAGTEISVPKLTGKSLPQAKKIIKQKGLKLHVDSMSYDPAIPPLQVISQNPEPKTKVKPGRTIYINVNKKQPTLIPIPPYHEYVAGEDYIIYLRNRGFKIKKIDTIFNSAAPDQVVNVLFNGKSVKSQEKLPKGASVSIVINVNKSYTDSTNN